MMFWIGILLVGFFLLVIITIVGYTLKTGISPMPGSAAARREILRQLKIIPDHHQKKTIVDLGSGWGHLVISVARQFPQHRVVGYELSLFPWLTSIALKHLLRLDNLILYRKDFFNADLSGADILLCYLFPQAMNALHEKIQQEDLRIEILISNCFALPSRQADQTVRLKDAYNTPIYLYRF
jgi:hypothetical protein